MIGLYVPRLLDFGVLIRLFLLAMAAVALKDRQGSVTHSEESAGANTAHDR
jgi:hypothetical protein